MVVKTNKILRMIREMTSQNELEKWFEVSHKDLFHFIVKLTSGLCLREDILQKTYGKAELVRL